MFFGPFQVSELKAQLQKVMGEAELATHRKQKVEAEVEVTYVVVFLQKKGMTMEEIRVVHSSSNQVFQISAENICYPFYIKVLNSIQARDVKW